APDRFLMVCNAGPRERVLAWVTEHGSRVRIEDLTFDYLCLALQGPKAARVLQLLTQSDVAVVKAFGGAYVDLLLGERLGTGRTPAASPPEGVGWGPFDSRVVGASKDFCFVTRTGYTGEDGFEMFPPKDLGVAAWNALLAAGREAGLRPVGLGARDTLRLEKGFLLSGTDFDGRQTSLECASEWLVKWDHDFVGREALRRQKERGKFHRLVGLLLQDRGVPRHGCTVLRDEANVGVVTSGTLSPSLKTGIALARVHPGAAAEGTSLDVVVRDRRLRAVVKKPPFL
ncbi:MAG: glycine cleavage T C-terminal barrel domain-containing protein, partial [Candidatus Thermoplasmatota archaeon]